MIIVILNINKTACKEAFLLIIGFFPLHRKKSTWVNVWQNDTKKMIQFTQDMHYIYNIHKAQHKNEETKKRKERRTKKRKCRSINKIEERICNRVNRLFFLIIVFDVLLASNFISIYRTVFNYNTNNLIDKIHT